MLAMKILPGSMLRKIGDPQAEISVSPDRGKIYIKSTKLKGIGLDKYLATHAGLTFAERLDLVDRIADAIEKLHALNIYHLDLKPENILIDDFGNINIIDFGSAYEKKDGAAFHPGEHETTPLFQALEHLGFENLNMKEEEVDPGLLDAYSATGIFAMILSYEDNIRDEKTGEKKEEYKYLPVMQNKREVAENKSITALQTSPKFDRSYALDTLNKVSYLQEDQRAQTTMLGIISELKKIGAEKKDERDNISNFRNNIRNIAHEELKQHQLKTRWFNYHLVVIPKKALSDEQKKTLEALLSSTHPAIVKMNNLYAAKHKKHISPSLRAIADEILGETIKKIEHPNKPSFLVKMLPLAKKFNPELDKQHQVQILQGILKLPPFVIAELDQELVKKARDFSNLKKTDQETEGDHIHLDKH